MLRSTRARLSTFGVLLSAVLAVGSVSAQATKATPKPLATPPPSGNAEIISRAADYTNEVQTVLVPVDEKRSVPTNTASDSALVQELRDRIKKLESEQKVDKDEKQKRMLLNLDILTRSEQRSESLRKQMFEMIEKENTLKGRLEQIELDIRPEAIERTLQLSGSMKPEEVREARRRSLDAERRNLQSLLTEIQGTRTRIAGSLQKSEEMVEKLRAKLEKEIDDSFLKDDPDKF